jgi:hypothetical protein
MNSRSFARLAGLICLVGGALGILYGLLSVPFDFAHTSSGWPEGLWALVMLGMGAGVLGLAALGGARSRWVAGVGAAIAVSGCLIRFAVAVLDTVLPATATVNSPLLTLLLGSILLLLLGLLPLGVTTLRGRRLTGWRAWAPLLVWAYTFLPLAVYSLSRFWHFLLLGLWGIPWMLLGYVIFTSASPTAHAVHSTATATKKEVFQ